MSPRLLGQETENRTATYLAGQSRDKLKCRTSYTNVHSRWQLDTVSQLLSCYNKETQTLHGTNPASFTLSRQSVPRQVIQCDRQLCFTRSGRAWGPVVLPSWYKQGCGHGHSTHIPARKQERNLAKSEHFPPHQLQVDHKQHLYWPSVT